MALETYRRKRNFQSTREPQGGQAATGSGDSFVIQKHAARRLHYDFRLEMDGVLKSWAVAKGPSLVPGEKRLAVHVEDHPLEYGDFEGTIPKGEYGGGTVIVWDRGHWHPIGDAHKGYAKGHLDFELQGEKLGGRWHLVRMAGKPGEKRENWLLIKGDDAAARPDGADILDAQPDSVKTGRSLDDVADETPGWSSRTGKIDKPEAAPAKIKKAKRAELPDFVAPSLATLAAKPPTGKRWLHEIKFDGYRLLVRIERGKVRLLTRTGLDWTERFGPAIAAAFKALPVGAALIDGELVVENAQGASDFSALQAALSEDRQDGFLFYAFDLLHLDGFDLTPCRLTDRKAALEALIGRRGGERNGEHDWPLRFSASFEEEGALILSHACRLSLEGVVSKVKDGAYHSGRGRDWLKSKCSARQEFVIGGYVPSTTSRKAIGSLVLGYYERDKLIHVGRVGTGFTARVAEDLYRRLEALRRPDSPFAQPLGAEEKRHALYVEPSLVAEVEFRAWTADQHLRHAAFRGLREDKPATEIVREGEMSDAAPPSGTPARPPTRPAVKLTHPDRLYWPDAGVTKEGLAGYYSDVWRRIAPFLVNRPLALVRCPGGFESGCFFQKHAWDGLSKSIRLTPDPADKQAEKLLSITDLDGLIGLVQGGVLEIHPWGATLDAIEQPDFITMDLDPGDGITWPDIIAGAEEIRERFARAGLASFVKTSGGKGLHVVAPLEPKAEWPAVKDFAKSVADAMAADSPDRYVAVVTKAKRKGKILVDYLRNGRGATAVAPYSTRARAGAPVSMPLGWNELASCPGAAYFTVANTPARLARQQDDPWADFRKAAVALPATGGKRKRV